MRHGAWTPEGNDSGRGDGYVTAEKLTHQELEKQWEKNLDGKWDRKGNVGEVTSSRRCDDVKVLTSRFEIKGPPRENIQRLSCLALRWTFSRNTRKKVKFNLMARKC
jgi:hypothetical protein